MRWLNLIFVGAVCVWGRCSPMLPPAVETEYAGQDVSEATDPTRQEEEEQEAKQAEEPEEGQGEGEEEEDDE